jgi:aminoglycoside 6'-N-acetyltransferase
MGLPVVRAERLILRPLADADLDRLAAILAAPGVAEWWSPPAPPDATRAALGRDGSAFGIEVEGELVGWLGFQDDSDEDWRATGLDIFLAPSHQRRGLGPEALRAAMRWLADERGCARFTIDPAVTNVRAIAAYEAAGFRPVGVMRAVERGAGGEWRDNLLMDMLASELDER